MYSILPLGAGEIRLPAESQLLGAPYEIAPGGDRFIRDVSVEFVVDGQEAPAGTANRIAIAQLSANGAEWHWMPTERTATNGKFVFQTAISELSAPRAVYALGIGPAGTEKREPPEAAPHAAPLPGRDGTLVSETFENTLGTWKSTDHFVGAILNRDNTATPDGSYALRLTNPSASGNFSVSVLDMPFDVAQYPIMSFDYRIDAGVGTDFYLSIDGRWYNLAFTGAGASFRNRDVNIANLGRIDGILSDGAWHTAQVNLHDLIRARTAYTRVDEIRMADWQATGYMKLEFGHNPKGATYYIDNFKLSSASAGAGVVPILDDFAKPGVNALGGATGTFSAPGTDLCHAETAGNVLQLTYDTRRSGSWCGYYSALEARDFRGMRMLSFRVRGLVENRSVLIGLRQAATRREIKVPLRPYIFDPDGRGWQAVRIPLSVFSGSGLENLKSLDLLTLTFEHTASADQGTLSFSDFRVEPTLEFSSVLDMTRFPMEENLLGGGFRTTANGAAAISAGYHEEMRSGDMERSVRISYGGNIGLNYGGGGFSYAVWETDLVGFDAREYQDIVIRIMGQKGGERPNIYLDDGIARRCIRASEFPAPSGSWQEIALPLERFRDAGVDLSHLEALQLDFEWEEMSGTVYVSEVHFTKGGRASSSPPGPSAKAGR